MISWQTLSCTMRLAVIIARDRHRVHPLRRAQSLSSVWWCARATHPVEPCTRRVLQLPTRPRTAARYACIGELASAAVERETSHAQIAYLCRSDYR